MPIRSNIAVPQCPELLPLASGSCIPGSVNWNRLVASQLFLQQAGVPLFEACSQRNNGQVRPVSGFFGNNFTENTAAPVAPEATAEIQRGTYPVEILPGLNRGVLVVTMKLAALPGPAPGFIMMNQQLVIKVTKGAASQTVASFRAVTGTGFLPGIITMSAFIPSMVNQIYTTAIPFIFDAGIIPQAGITELGAVVIETRKFNPRGTVTGQGTGYFDGCLHCQIKQYKDC